MKHYILFLLLLCLSINTQAQSKETDSIFSQFNLKYSEEELLKAKLEYEAANDTIKILMRQLYSMPTSSKAELIENYNQNSDEINNLINEFEKSIPKNLIVYLEIETDDTQLKQIKNIDMQILKVNKNKEIEVLATDWNIEYGSEELDSYMSIIGWDPLTFSGMKNLMQVANCISIQNNTKYTEVGFARSGVGKYSYLFFPKKQSKMEILRNYNDGCNYIHLKDNIVLKYEGGMIGPQCFTD